MSRVTCPACKGINSADRVDGVMISWCGWCQGTGAVPAEKAGGPRRATPDPEVKPMGMCPFPHCPLPEDHDGAHLLPSDGAPEPAEVAGVDLPPADPELGWEAIRKAHERYAFGQVRTLRANMRRDLERDTASGKLEGVALLRAKARMASFDQLVDTLETLKGLIK